MVVVMEAEGRERQQSLLYLDPLGLGAGLRAALRMCDRRTLTPALGPGFSICEMGTGNFL
jgi:hypothetical protein